MSSSLPQNFFHASIQKKWTQFNASSCNIAHQQTALSEQCGTVHVPAHIAHNDIRCHARVEYTL
jgi:hypothetical protein